MSIWTVIAQVSTGINVVALLVLSYIWIGNYRRFRSKHTAGFAVFALLLLAENVLALYYYLVDPTLAAWFASDVPAVAWRALMLLRVLETVAVAFLLWVTWD